MSKPVEQILASILEDYARCEKTNDELEAKSLFRILNYCPPVEPGTPLKGQCLAIELLDPGFQKAMAAVYRRRR